MWKSWKRRALAENKTDYSKYRFSWQEYLLCFFKAFFATGAFTGMFYRSWLGMLAFPAVWKVLYGRDKKNRIQKRKERLSLQFKDTILEKYDRYNEYIERYMEEVVTTEKVDVVLG